MKNYLGLCLLLFLAAACRDDAPPSGKQQCGIDVDKQRCPDGFECVSDLCWRIGTAPAQDAGEIDASSSNGGAGGSDTRPNNMVDAGDAFAADCGNGIKEPGEDCDDGNAVDTDLCSAKCEACNKRPGHLECGGACIAGAECCPGERCGAAASCASDMVTARGICGADNRCSVPKAAACDSFFTCADAVSCRTACTGDAQCVGGRKCLNNTCVTPSCGNGVPEGEDCDDGNKDDADLCSNACVSCSKRPGYLTCGASCIADATCCPGTSCSAATCSGLTYTAPTTCSAAGRCAAGTPMACPGSFVCDGASCRTTCSADAHCASDAYCTAGKCMPKSAAGKACQGANQCGTGNCVNEVCCKASTCGPCEQCNASGDGTCSAIAGCICDGFLIPNSPSSGLPNSMSYDTSVAGIVKDKITKLKWERGNSARLETRAEALAYCTAKGGSWRLPTVSELYTLVNVSRSQPALDAAVFVGTPANGLFWTSTPLASDPQSVWVVNFSSGTASPVSVNSTVFATYARCVDSSSEVLRCYGPPRFTEKNGEIFDKATGLTWQKTFVGSKTWAQSQSHCAEQGAGFRAPSVTELRSIVNTSRRDPSIETSLFPVDPEVRSYWTSSGAASYSDEAWTVSFYLGVTSTLTTDATLQVRCVK